MRPMLVSRLALALTLPLAVAATACAAEPPMGGPVPPTGMDVPRMEGFDTQVLISTLEVPWAIAWTPDGRHALITERPGRLRVADVSDSGDYTLRDEPVAGLPEILELGQGGLMDVSVHPNFADNRLVYLTFTAGSQRENHTVLARGRLSEDLTALEDARVIWEVDQLKPGGQHFGSRILWLPDGTLLLAIGDGGNPPTKIGDTLTRDFVQDLSSDFGKIHRLTDAGEPAPGNPFADNESADPSVYSLGHRNIQGMAITPDGTVYATEHGARGGDELNLIRPGSNYGWPLATYSLEYGGPAISENTSLPGMADPLVVWTPVIAASGLAYYTGDRYPGWQGDLFAGGLLSQQVRYVDLDEAGKPASQKFLPFDQRVRDVRQGPDGYLYVLTESRAPDGKLHRIVPAAN